MFNLLLQAQNFAYYIYIYISVYLYFSFSKLNIIINKGPRKGFLIVQYICF